MRRVGMLFCGLIFIGGLLLLVSVVPGLFSPFAWGWGSESYRWGIAPWAWGGFGFPLWGLGMFVFCLLMMGGMMMHGGPLMHSGHGNWVSRRDESLLDMLERRYSRGEITQAQFEEMRQTLGVPDASSAIEHAHH